MLPKENFGNISNQNPRFSLLRLQCKCISRESQRAWNTEKTREKRTLCLSLLSPKTQRTKRAKQKGRKHKQKEAPLSFCFLFTFSCSVLFVVCVVAVEGQQKGRGGGWRKGADERTHAKIKTKH